MSSIQLPSTTQSSATSFSIEDLLNEQKQMSEEKNLALTSPVPALSTSLQRQLITQPAAVPLFGFTRLPTIAQHPAFLNPAEMMNPNLVGPLALQLLQFPFGAMTQQLGNNGGDAGKRKGNGRVPRRHSSLDLRHRLQRQRKPEEGEVKEEAEDEVTNSKAPQEAEDLSRCNPTSGNPFGTNPLPTSLGALKVEGGDQAIEKVETAVEKSFPSRIEQRGTSSSPQLLSRTDSSSSSLVSSDSSSVAAMENYDSSAGNMWPIIQKESGGNIGGDRASTHEKPYTREKDRKNAIIPKNEPDRSADATTHSQQQQHKQWMAGVEQYMRLVFAAQQQQGNVPLNQTALTTTPTLKEEATMAKSETTQSVLPNGSWAMKNERHPPSAFAPLWQHFGLPPLTPHPHPLLCATGNPFAPAPLFRPLHHGGSAHRSASGINGGSAAQQGRRKGGQIRFTNEQTDTLESTFDAQKYLTNQHRKKLAKSLTLSERQVKTWFQNRRAKWRRIRKDGEDEEDLSLHGGIHHQHSHHFTAGHHQPPHIVAHQPIGQQPW